MIFCLMTRITMNVANTTRVLKLGPMNRETRVSSSPRNIPAKNAPPILPRPPTTTTINALNPKLAPAVGLMT